MTSRNNATCLMCGTDPDRLTEQKIILGSKGAICVECIRACAAAVSGANEPAIDPTTFEIADTGECFLCGKAELGVSSISRLSQGLRGELCLNCVELCKDILNDPLAST